MTSNELAEITIKHELIESLADIEWLFPTYDGPTTNLSLNEIIETVIKWAYESDNLEEFYFEHSDSLIQSGNIDYTLGCNIVFNTSIRTTTTFELFRFNSKNLSYYIVVGSGEFSEDWDTHDFFEIVNQNANTDVLQAFKYRCHEVFNLYDEFDHDKLINDGHSVEFYN